jgi:hypothetical protein
MSSLEIDDTTLQIRTAVVTESELLVFLKDGRHVAMPLWWSPRLYNATPEQRDQWFIMGFGDALGWEEIDEHLSVKGIMLGEPFPGAMPPQRTHARQTEHV